MAHTKRSKPHSFAEATGSVLDPMEKIILKYMTDHSPSESTKLQPNGIAKGVGKVNKKDINKFLYALQKRNLVKKVQESPPLWTIVKSSQATKAAMSASSSYSVGSSAQATNAVMSVASSYPMGSSMPRYVPTVTKEPTQQPAPVHKCNSPVNAKDDFHLPRTPDQLINDLNSEFSKIAVKDISTSVRTPFWIGQPQASKPSASVAPAPSPPLPSIAAGKNAIAILNEYAQSRRIAVPQYDEKMSGPPHKPSFWTTVSVGGKRYQGAIGANKRDAKLKAAEAALSALHASNDIPGASVNSSECYDIVSQASSSIHDKVAALVNQKYNEMLQLLPDTITGRKIIAGFVMSTKLLSGEDYMEVISIGSGNRCVMGDKLSLVGTTVNDCHAEVIARRGLVRYFYKELLSPDNSIFVRCKDRYQLRPDIKFHLYISTAPCGDSAIFAPSDSKTDQENQAGGDGAHHPIFENKKQGVLRTKIENGEGCIPIEEDTAAPTWDGILRGERLRTMSCSDKIAKWNYLGLQGSLLSHFLEKPIYMSTLTLGMLYNHGHLTRAICCRVQKALTQSSVAPGLYDVHHPAVAGQNHNRETGKMKTREFSLNWNVGDDRPEVLDGTTGRCEARFGSADPPRLCKAQLFSLFKQLCDQTNQSELYKKGYFKSKTSSEGYHNAKLTFWKSLEMNGFGKWMSKPKDEKDF